MVLYKFKTAVQSYENGDRMYQGHVIELLVEV